MGSLWYLPTLFSPRGTNIVSFGRNEGKRAKPNRSKEPPAIPYKPWKTYRLSRIPAAFSGERLVDSFRNTLGFEGNIELKFLGTDVSEMIEPTWRTAIVTFSVKPPFERKGDQMTWTIQLPSTDGSAELQPPSVVDTKMLGFTPISPVATDTQQIIE